MNKSLIDRLEEFRLDIVDLKTSGDSTQNEIWGHQFRPFLLTTTISESDLKDFDHLLQEMRYTSQPKPYNAMNLFLKLVSRKNLEYKKSDIESLLQFNPARIVPAKKVQYSRRRPSVVLNTDVTESLADIVKSVTPEKLKSASNKIFIVHGNDGESKLELSVLLKDMGLEPIILHQQANKGKTVIEKFEEYAGEVNFAFVLFTPDDVGGKDEQHLQSRARQNVILEFGYFLGKLGRKRVCCLYKKNIERPSDMEGLVYIPFDRNPRDSYLEIKKELTAAGYSLKPL